MQLDRSYLVRPHRAGNEKRRITAPVHKGRDINVLGCLDDNEAPPCDICFVNNKRPHREMRERDNAKYTCRCRDKNRHRTFAYYRVDPIFAAEITPDSITTYQSLFSIMISFNVVTIVLLISD